MQYGLAAWGLRFTPLREQLAMVRRLNLELLELGISGFYTDLLQSDSPDCFVETVGALFRENALTPCCAATGNDFTMPDATDTMDSLRRTLAALKLADMLGIRYLRIFAGFAPAAEVTGRRWRLLADCLREVYAAAKDTGVIPVVETHGGVENLPDGSVRHFASVSTECETLDRLLDDVPDMRLNYDPANVFLLGKDICDFYRRYREKIAYMHLKEFIRGGEGWRPAACGAGEMNWSTLINEIKAFSGPVMLEYEVPSDVENGFEASLKFLQQEGSKIAC